MDQLWRLRSWRNRMLVIINAGCMFWFFVELANGIPKSIALFSACVALVIGNLILWLSFRRKVRQQSTALSSQTPKPQVGMEPRTLIILGIALLTIGIVELVLGILMTPGLQIFPGSTIFFATVSIFLGGLFGLRGMRSRRQALLHSNTRK